MGKKKINLKYLLLLLLMITMRAQSQGLITKELKWETPDSGKVPIFENREQIMEWSKSELPGSEVTNSKDILINGCNFYFVTVVGCSGMPCWDIYIFKEKDGLWQLIRSSKARIAAKIEILVDNEKRVIIFETISGTISKPKYGQIGELPFEKINAGL